MKVLKVTREHDRITARLEVSQDYALALIAEGWTRDEAYQEAFREVTTDPIRCTVARANELRAAKLGPLS